MEVEDNDLFESDVSDRRKSTGTSLLIKLSELTSLEVRSFQGGGTVPQPLGMPRDKVRRLVDTPVL